jgi:hypothetical protein
MKLDFHSQAMAPDGSSIAQFASQAIKDSNLVPKHVMLREALQNSCDQRNSKDIPIDFFVATFAMKGATLEFLKNLIGKGVSKGDPLGVGPLLKRKQVEVLVFADKGTKGLGGVTDASKPNVGNFAKYFFIFGRVDDASSTDGGAFGAGRTTLNNASIISSVLVYSRFKSEKGNTESRFMGLANGKSFEFEEKMYTGRHWWCKSNSGHAQPIEGVAADEIARHLGMDAYLGSETGFVAFVLAPIFVTSENPELAALERKDLLLDLQEAAYLYGWPHMIKVDGKKSVNFHFILDGKEIELKDPKELGHLANFIDCYEDILRARSESDYRSKANLKEIIFVDSQKSFRTGLVCWKYSLVKDSDQSYQDLELVPLHAVALIRNAGFVVKYEKVATYAEGLVTRGVFLVDENFEGKFRAAEPIAHDDWIPSRLGLLKGEKNPIKQSLDQLRSTFKSINDENPIVKEGEPLVYASALLGSLVGGYPSVGVVAKTSKGKPTKPRQGLSIRMENEPYPLSTNENYYLASFHYVLVHDDSEYSHLSLEIEAFIALGNSILEKEPPFSRYLPNIKQVVVDGHDLIGTEFAHEKKSSTIRLKYNREITDIEVLVECKHGLAVTCKVNVTGIK